MEKDMQSYRLSDLVKIKNGKDHKMLSNGKYPVLGSGGIMRYVDRFLYNKPSVLLPRKGTLDNIQYCDVPFWTVDTLYYTEVNTNLANPYYLYRYLSLLDLSNLDSGTGVPSMTFDNYYGLKIFLPNIEKQTKIAQILQTLDKKITINRQINQNLEAMAKQLYDYWFVQFDFPNENGKPYKSCGGKMVWNEKLKREIPSCFNIANMEKLCKFRNGINYSKDETGNDFQIVNVRNISSSKILLDGEDFDTITVPMTKAENYLLKSEDIIIARSGCPGSTRLLISPTNTLFCGFIICCTPHNSSMRNYLTYCLKQLEGTNATTSGGSILQNVSQDTLKGLPIVVPNKQIINKFNETIELIFTRILNCLKETKAFTKQRDELLPLLMNGQVSVNSDLSVYKKRRGKVPSSILNDVSDI